MKKSYFLDGKLVTKKEIKNNILVKTINAEYYETPAYRKQQSINTMNFFAKMREDREELEKRH